MNVNEALVLEAKLTHQIDQMLFHSLQCSSIYNLDLRVSTKLGEKLLKCLGKIIYM